MAEHSFISITYTSTVYFPPMVVSEADYFYLSFAQHYKNIPTKKKLEVVGNWKSGKELDNVYSSNPLATKFKSYLQSKSASVSRS